MVDNNNNINANTTNEVVLVPVVTTVTSIITTQQQQIQIAQDDLASLVRVSHKLVMIKDSIKLCTVLYKLLPKLLVRIGSNNQLKIQHVNNSDTNTNTNNTNTNTSTLISIYNQIHIKLIEILSHTLKRVRNDIQCTIPLVDILTRIFFIENTNSNATDSNTTNTTLNFTNSNWKIIIPSSNTNSNNNNIDTFTINLSIMFLMVGIQRCTDIVELIQLLPYLLQVFTYYGTCTNYSLDYTTSKKMIAEQITFILLHCIHRIVLYSNNNNNTNKNTTGSTNVSDTSNNINTCLDYTRQLINNSSSIIGDAIHELFVDVLLYSRNATSTSTTSTTGSTSTVLPPPGMSQFGIERLVQFQQQLQSTSTNNTTNDFIRNYKQYKNSIVTFISPQKRWCIFLSNNNNNNNNINNAINNNIDIIDNTTNDIGIARTIMLLVIASGLDGSDFINATTTSTGASSIYNDNPAVIALKYHLDQYKKRSSTTTTNNVTNYTTTNTTGNDNNSTLSITSCTGGYNCTLSMSIALLSLCLGQYNTERYLSSFKSLLVVSASNNNVPTSTSTDIVHPIRFCTVQRYHNDTTNNSTTSTSTTTSTTAIQQVPQHIKLSTRRRPLDITSSSVNTNNNNTCSVSTSILSFLATKVLDEYPTFFDDYIVPVLTTTTRTTTDTNSTDTDTDSSSSSSVSSQLVIVFGTIAVHVLNKCLGSTNTTMPISIGLSNIRGKPYIAASTLLLSLTIRLSLCYDTTIVLDNNNNNNNNNNNRTLNTAISTNPHSIERILAQLLTIACTVLGPIANNVTNGSNNNGGGGYSNEDGSISIRDNCYGVICTLSRSQFALLSTGYIFSEGISEQDNVVADVAKTTTTTSTRTTMLLFGCAGNEVERLRPRAVAALDALLSAYRRLYRIDPTTTTTTTTPSQNVVVVVANTTQRSNVKSSEQAANPWAETKPIISSPTNILPDNTTNSQNTQIQLDPTKLVNDVYPLLWKTSQKRTMSSSVRIAAARWSCDLLKTIDITKACHLLCYLAGDDDPTVSSIAKDGIGLMKTMGTDDDTATSSNKSDYIDSMSNLPDFKEFVQLLFPLSTNTVSYQITFQDFNIRSKAATLRFTLTSMLHDLYGGDDDAVALYLSALVKTLDMYTGRGTSSTMIDSSQNKFGAIDLLDDCSFCFQILMSSSTYARGLFLTNSDSTLPIGIDTVIQLCQNATSAKARRYLALACFYLFGTNNENQNNVDLVTNKSFHSWLVESRVDQTLAMCAKAFLNIQSTSINQLHGSIHLGAQVVKCFRLRSLGLVDDSNDIVAAGWKNVGCILNGLGTSLLHTEESVGNACADGIAIALSYVSDDVPLLDNRLLGCVSSLLLKLTTGLTKFGHSDSVNISRVTKSIRASGICLASSLSVSESDEKETLASSRFQCVDALFELLGSNAYRKEEELSIVVGEAFSDYCDAYSPSGIFWDNEDLQWVEETEIGFDRKLPPHEQVMFCLLRKMITANSPHKKTASVSALFAIVARGARKLHVNRSYETRALVRCLMKHLEEIQGVFVTMLAYPKCSQLARESCCLGLAACRGLLQAIQNNLLDESRIHQRLLTAFGQTTNHGGSAMMETPAQAAARRSTQNSGTSTTDQTNSTIMEQFGDEPDVGGVAGMGEAVLGAYREMAAASVSLGRQDILYALLILSVSHVYWRTGSARHFYNAAALLGEESELGKSSSLNELRAALRPSFNRILPRILRACNDPNKQTREQMHSLWLGLTGGGADARQVITNNLLPVIDSLLIEASGKLWRTRVGACGALSEVIVGREWSALGGGGVVLSDDDLFDCKVESAGIRLLKLWRVVVRALDDVHGSVRAKGETLARAVRALTVRLCNPSPPDKPSGHKRSREDGARYVLEAAAAAGTSLRWLLKQGLNQSDEEATGICMSTLVELVGVVEPKILEPSVPDLLRSLLLATSNLEPSVLNYLQLRTSDQENTERARLQIAQSGPIALAVTKCVDLIPFLSSDTQKNVAPELEAALRLSTGFATRVAVADAVSTLCSNCPAVFAFTSTSISNPSIRLLRSFYFACERERGAASIDKMIHALGNLASLCPGRSVRSLAVRACNRYRESTGNYDDLASRKAAALALRALAVRASNHFSDGGKNEIWERFVLPATYLGRKDPDSKIASLFAEVWEEGGNATKIVSDTTEAFGGTLEENLLPFLVHECILALQDVSWGRRVAGAAAISDLCNLGVLSPLKVFGNKQTNLETNEFKLRAKARAKCCHNLLNQCIQLLARPRIWKGKSSVTTAVSSMTTAWVSAISDERFDQISLFGCEDTVGICPWQPILVQQSDYSCDLFLGDQWFASPASTEEQVEEGAASIKSDDIVMERQTIDNMTELEEFEPGFQKNLTTETNDSINDSVDRNILTFIGLCQFLAGQGFPSSRSKHNETEESLPYRTTSLRAFQDIVNSLPLEEQHLRYIIFEHVGSKLLDSCTNINDGPNKESPVIIAAALGAISSCFWHGMGRISSDSEQLFNLDNIVSAMKDIGGKNQAAWTVRESAALAVGHFASLCHVTVIRQSTTLMTMLDVSFFALTDPKFWRVRIAGLKIIECLTSRTGTGHGDTSDEKQLILESLLPYKDQLLSQTRKMLADTESNVTALSTKVLASMSWWP